MSNSNTPSDIARETLKALAARKLAPTPENYAHMYHEIGGEPAPATATSKATIVPVWSELIRDLLRQLETPHKGITVTRKKEGVETVLSRFAKDPAVLFEKLRGLMHSWSGAPTAHAPDEFPPLPAQPATKAAAPKSAATSAAIQPDNRELMDQLRELLALALESTLASQPEMADEIKPLAALARSASNQDGLDELARQLRQFWYKLEMRGGDKNRIQEGLVRLLRLLVENVSEMVEDDKWLHGQVAALQEIVAKPLDRHAIADAERSLRDAVIKQGMLKQDLTDAKSTLKSLMATFIDRLGELTESTGEYHNKIDGYSQKIGKAGNMAELGHILKDVMRDTRAIQASAMRSHEEMLNHKKQADAAEAKIRELEQELEQVSELVREDQLTGALNRRGLDESLDREIKRSNRSRFPVSIALLDIDNFKRLNDTLGHQAGDLALKHLTKVIKETLRPADTVGRYGGEEFLIVLPDTDLDSAVEAIRRLQRDLTKKFFMHKNERILVTFSAGVALRSESEDADDLIARADKAMYRAKLAGKNRVEPAEEATRSGVAPASIPPAGAAI
ncbi:MAG: diguanylate cyclase [Gammaproteobacteria bacterium]|nr:diguanylate cyclase [Gammaproteobacteria bacterium]MBU1777101.1 diguanylate cyclase [Gammaproteobacteria bacterium]MBU1968425.1 diguanylate cyclase [Gammaproteobacteria bacterium]